MTSDRDTALGELVYEAAARLWSERAAGATSEPPSATAGADHDIAEVTDTDLDTVRRWLADFDGERLTLGREGDTVVVKGLVDPMS